MTPPEPGLPDGESRPEPTGVDINVVRFWDRESRKWGDKYATKTSYYYRRKIIYDYFRSTGLSGASILDYGCGSGDITFPMLQEGNSVTGVDIASDMVAQASLRAIEFGLAKAANYQHLDDRALSEISSRAFDAVICSSVLEYVADDIALVRLFYSVLKTGGYLIVSVPDGASLFCRADKWMYANRRIMPSFVPVEKLRYLEIQKRQYDVDEFEKTVATVGFIPLQKRFNTVKLQRGLLMEKFSNIKGVGMLAFLLFRKA